MTTPTLPNPNVNNMTVCTDFVATPGQTTTFLVDNAASGRPSVDDRLLEELGFLHDVEHEQEAGARPDAREGFPRRRTSAWSCRPRTWAPLAELRRGLLLRAPGRSGQPERRAGLLEGRLVARQDGVHVKKKLACDPLFNMTAQLIAAQLNYFAGAGANGPTTTNIVAAGPLNGRYQSGRRRLPGEVVGRRRLPEEVVGRRHHEGRTTSQRSSTTATTSAC